MMTFVKFVNFLWPFLKEMILGGKTLRQALRHHMGRLLLVGMIIVSVGLNFFAIPKLLSISYEYVELKRKYTALTKAGAEPALQPASAPQPQIQSSGPVAEPAEKPASEVDDQYRQTKELFKRLREKERYPYP